MAKRFTDTNKYKKPFIRSLKGPYKILWDYLYHDCDHAGIWIVDFEVAQLYIGNDMLINKEDALKYFNNGEKRIVEIDNGQRWFIPSFIEIQYGELNESNRAHSSVICILKKYGLVNFVKKENKVLKSPLIGAKDKNKDMDMEKDMEKEKEKDKDRELIKDLKITPEFQETFLRWLHYKRKRGESYKDKDSTFAAYKKLYRISSKDPLMAAKVIEEAMANNYAGFFELREDKVNGKPQPKEVLEYGEAYTLRADGKYRSKKDDRLLM